MFPVPQHLPRTGGESFSSEIPDQDPVLYLLTPLISQGESSKFTGQQVRAVRESLEKAVNDNKGKSHQLVINNFPSISSQIQLSTNLHSDISDVRRKVTGLEDEIDHSDSQTSFLPPLINSLNRHFSASSSRSSAQAHIRALKSLSKHTERIKKLEEAVWSGRAADQWVLDELRDEKGYLVDIGEEGEEILRGTKIMKDINTKTALLKSMVMDQLTEGFNAAIAFSHPTSAKGMTLTVQNTITLQHPRTNPPPQLKTTTLSHYIFINVYSALSRLSLLDDLLQTLSKRIQKDLIRPIVSSTHSITISSTDKLSLLRLEPSPDIPPQKVLENIRSILSFTLNTIFPPSFDLPERQAFVSSLMNSAFQSILDFLILPSLPPTLTDAPTWLETLRQATEVESDFCQDESESQSQLIRPFFESEAGSTWAQQRRYAIADEIRRLILGGWGGWESVVEKKEKEVISYFEVEVDVEDDVPMVVESQKDGEEDFGWGFDDSTLPKDNMNTAKVEEKGNQDVNMEDDGWGFDESSTASAGPSSPPKPSNPPLVQEEDEADGWDLDPSPSHSILSAESEPTIIPVPAPIPKPAKPAREAKRLGKKVAKVKHEEEYDPWGSPDPDEDTNKATNGKDHHHPQIPSPTKPDKVVPSPSIVKQDNADDGWGWDDDSTPASVPSTGTTSASTDIPALNVPSKPTKRKEVREEKKLDIEHYLVSTSCETLVDIAKSVLKDIEELGSLELSSPSFNVSIIQPILLESIKEVFTFYRALLPTHFANQLRDVPSLSMQAHNDCFYLSGLVSQLSIQDTALNGEKEKLMDLAEHIYETQIDFQRTSMLESLDELNELQGTNEDKIFKRNEKVLKGVIHNLESLDRVIKPVLPSSKHLEFISHLVTTLTQRLMNDVLTLGDITEVESNRLTDLFKLVYPLEHIFEPEGGVVRWVGGGWLKFCYISEILQASLVDITYLIDSGSLIDFTPDELIGLVRALFAHSEKRDSVIERIERDGTGGQPIS
ncbi:hypothetical protein I203_105805 [Kwoniella mangroviensis CBS 8507]|uniref:uncharacterized protein n=1 Tax=Kwoniella mangroviensis CBS 8507 TaxID=1296122 RepID=UPI00080D05EA|nr:uncharacterized protein I203_01617 [Kwoniella mangroviensis CBS 8507]OCF69753.1 hypothetical protein I203_01617 [Kwoniella mangroviensis CBS 8507]